MGRIRQTIKVDGRECWTLFHTGARNTYVVRAVGELLATSEARSRDGGQILISD